MNKRETTKVHAMEELASGSSPLRDIEQLSAEDVRAMVYVLIERIKRIEEAIKEKASDATRRFEGFPKDYVGTTLYDKDIEAITAQLVSLSNWKEGRVGSANTVTTITNFIVAVFGGSIGAAIMYLLSGGIK